MLQVFRRAGCPLVLAAVALLAVPAAGAQPVVTLTGERLSGTTTNATVDCGDPSTITYEITGMAIGPYPRPFTEEVELTFAADGTVETFSATFSIDSPAGTVTGSKQLDLDDPLNFGTCGPAETIPEFAEVTLAERYEATITDALGRTFHEEGRATSALSGQDGQLTVEQSFQSGGPPGTTIELTPVTAFNPTGTSHTVTAVVRQGTEPVQGMTVLFVVTSPTGSTARCVTDSDGVCAYTYQGRPIHRRTTSAPARTRT